MAGAYAAAGALALLGRPGFHHFDVDWTGALLSGIELDISVFLHRASRPRDPGVDASGRDPQAGLQSGAFPAGAFRCADGFVVPGTVRPLDWSLQCEIYGRSDLLEDERFSIRNRWAHRHELAAEIQPWYDAHQKREIFEMGLSKGWAVAMVVTAGDVLDDPHMTERGFVGDVTVNGDAASAAVVPVRPWKASNLTVRPADGANPRLVRIAAG